MKTGLVLNMPVECVILQPHSLVTRGHPGKNYSYVGHLGWFVWFFWWEGRGGGGGCRLDFAHKHGEGSEASWKAWFIIMLIESFILWFFYRAMAHFDVPHVTFSPTLPPQVHGNHDFFRNVDSLYCLLKGLWHFISIVKTSLLKRVNVLVVYKVHFFATSLYTLTFRCSVLFFCNFILSKV